MAEQDKINLLHQKLDFLIKRQDGFQKEISELKMEINLLQNENVSVPEEIETFSFSEEKTSIEKPILQKEKVVFSQPIIPQREPRLKKPSNWEKFIGENLINKIGVLILVIGVGIGAKYAIDNELISPLTRIILGYLVGLGLLGFALKLKQKFESFSAVLLSGSMAIMYFITFLAYSLYGLLPQSLTFAIMVVFTIFTVFSALKYNQQVIAIIGLVGAYAVPFLLSDGSGKVVVLFTYMALINAGILIIAFKKYWRLLNLLSFAATWIIFSFWVLAEFEVNQHFTIALNFLIIFFAIFYSAFLAYKLIKNENYEARDIFSVFSNSFIFYGLGVTILNNHPVFTHYLGLFTLVNAIIHFGVSTLIYKKKLADKSLFYLIIGLVLTFITLAVPIQLDGQWVTLAWAFQGGLLFWLGRTKKVSLYENLSYIIMLLSFFSLLEDWFQYSNTTAVFNADFLNSLLYTASFVCIFYIQRKLSLEESHTGKSFAKIMHSFVPILLVFVFYNAIRMEISTFWELKYEASGIKTSSNQDYYDSYDSNFIHYKVTWIINFSILYLIGLLVLMEKKFKNPILELSLLILSAFATLIFLTQGLFTQSDLVYSYYNLNAELLFSTGIFAVVLHYISLLFFGFLIHRIYLYYIQKNDDRQTLFEVVFSVVLVWVLSAEMLIWINAFNSYNNNKIALSILWGTLSLLLIGYGIWKNRKHLRLLAIILFGNTLIKLFFYDIAHLNTIRKTIVFVSLGILLLVISFLYNKYKHLILDDDKK